MTISSSTQVYLRHNIQFEPLISSWYAWYHTLPPLTAALNVAERFLPLLKSYAASPMMRARTRDARRAVPRPGRPARR